MKKQNSSNSKTFWMIFSLLLTIGICFEAQKMAKLSEESLRYEYDNIQLSSDFSRAYADVLFKNYLLTEEILRLDAVTKKQRRPF
jgi:hypothetical protein